MDDEKIAAYTFEEYKRISDAFHKAIDNYYKLFVVFNSILVLFFTFGSQVQINTVVYLILPYIILAVINLENQIRTTITCASIYMAELERKFNRVTDSNTLLYESQLTMGNTLYKRLTTFSVLKYLAYFPFFCIMLFVYIFAVFETNTSILRFGSVRVVGLFVTPATIFRWYLAILITVSVLTMMSVVSSFWFAMRRYHKIVADILERTNYLN